MDQLSKVKPISNMVIRDEQDIYNILTNREKLEYLLEEYEKKNNHLDNEEDVQQICCDEITPCVLNDVENYNSNNKKIGLTTTNPLDNISNMVDSIGIKSQDVLLKPFVFSKLFSILKESRMSYNSDYL